MSNMLGSTDLVTIVPLRDCAGISIVPVCVLAVCMRMRSAPPLAATALAKISSALGIVPDASSVPLLGAGAAGNFKDGTVF